MGSIDHRTRVAKSKRDATRHKLLDAAMSLFSDHVGPTPVIDDVVREANVSRGTFYNYFDSVDEVLAAVGQTLSDQMTADILPMYDTLREPWQRLSVGFRFFMVRALLDRKWAGFVTRVTAWQHDTLVARYLRSDLEQGRERGQFSFGRLDVATDFIIGATAYSIQTIRDGVAEPNAYMDAQVGMALACVGCDRDTRDRAVAFSLSHLQRWATSELSAGTPTWASNLASHEGQRFLAHALPRVESLVNSEPKPSASTSPQDHHSPRKAGDG
ncbi:TetR/AcrR family transcriptional regulator [Paraburkholderia monticola]|uniref:TetR/AcrR family transcriptional regulator n=1 Tax=Paraburkholderia monticola TaxID=1399968 RepID=UPI0007C6FF10|nr:TetR/AcrR family transcriptional regulator [Paraburkholderia monticola]